MAPSKRDRRVVRSCSLALLLVMFVTTRPAWAAHPAVIKEGKQLFLRDWSKATSPTALDGLGPLFNAVSCVACHKQGGDGGGGPNEHNVQLLTLGVMAVPAKFATEKVDLKALRQAPLHPGLASTSSVVLHRFSTNPGYKPFLRSVLARPPVAVIGKLEVVRELGITYEALEKLPKPAVDFTYALAYMRSERSTPALFGLGLIDRISQLDLEKLERFQNARYPELSGRVAPNGGKFGWRGQSDSVRTFVLGACANELGLQTHNFPQAVDPTALADPEGKAATDAPTNTPSDMTDYEITALVSYVSELPPPQEFRGTSPRDRVILTNGHLYFHQARCISCHVRQVGEAVGIYSDLLLHDMGPGLNDPAALSSSRGLSTQYYGTGESLLVSDEQKQEWRTPPLWGVRDSAPYLHDGRAATIRDAIKAHGGEAKLSAQRFEYLSPRKQEELIEFVLSLGTPTEKPAGLDGPGIQIGEGRFP